MAAVAQTFDLATGWRLKRTDEGDDAWMPVEKVPTVVHLDLINNKRIPDPFLGTNELEVEWIGEHSWTYETTFDGPSLLRGSSAYLVFEGLDTFATVRLNDVTILESDNMFLSHRVDITAALKPSADNKLVIDFDSALLRGRELQKQHPDHKYEAFNGESSRLCVRKAQYHWGWDWGPVLMTAGPWRPVRLEVSSTHIENVRIDYNIANNLSSVTGSVVADVEGLVDEITLVVSLGDNEVFRTSQKTSETNNISFNIDTPLLWYPHGYGEQSLYQFVVQASHQGTISDTWTKNTGFRKSELIQEPDQHGESFYFRINNIDVFCGGSCWIPADSLLPKIGPERYRSWLELMREGNQIMTRVWGGGIYEDDIFYNTCDELGILVWQDFMFACGAYPVWPELKDSIETEARDNIRRLRHHPSIIIWAGNNEDYQVQEQCHLEYDYENKDPESWLKSSFPGRYYYEHLLPAVMEEEAPMMQYWPGSPFSNGKLSSDLTAGDLHQWNVWHGSQEKYQRFDQIGGRFNSEFGMASFPALQTIKGFVTNEKDLFPQSHVLDFHNKADGHERRIGAYVLENFRNSSDLATWAYLTQLAQSEALTYAYRGWRRQWGENRRCGGALVWQLNDCWPATSWSIIDYHLRKKPSFYAIKRALLPVAVGVQREHHDWSVCHARPAKTSSYKIWISSSLQSEVNVDLELRFISIDTGKDVKSAITRDSIVVASNGTTDVLSGEVNIEAEEDHVLAVRVFQNGVCVSRDVDWPQPLKYLCFENRGVKVERLSGGFSVTSERPTKGLVIEESDEGSLSDNCLDVMPGDCQVLKVQGRAPEMPKSKPLDFQLMIQKAPLPLILTHGYSLHLDVHLPACQPTSWTFQKSTTTKPQIPSIGNLELHHPVLSADVDGSNVKDKPLLVDNVSTIWFLIFVTTQHASEDRISHVELAEAYSRAQKVVDTLFPSSSLEELSLMTRQQLLVRLQSCTVSQPTIDDISHDSLEVLEPHVEQNFTWDEVSETNSETSRVADDVNGQAFSRQSLNASYLGLSSVPTILRVIAHLRPHVQRRVPEGPQAWRSPSMYSGSPDESSVLQVDETSLINAYFDQIHPIIPMIDETEFRRRYSTADLPQDETGSWLALLNMVLAMGTMASESIHLTSHNMFYKRALSYINISSFGSGHIHMVQALALHSGMLLHFFNRPNTAAAVMGATIQMAVAMGLHRVQILESVLGGVFYAWIRGRLRPWVVQVLDIGIKRQCRHRALLP
ncbi:hypothetical protein ACHAQD_007331 [Fusarium lateritium]